MGQVGGKRAGAGRRPGSANRKTRTIADAASQAGLTPLEWMLSVVRDENADMKRRDEMAKAAAPYMHPRLAAVERRAMEEEPGHRPLRVQVTFVPGSPDPDRPEAGNGTSQVVMAGSSGRPASAPGDRLTPRSAELARASGPSLEV
jgi:hypothetical protein